MNLGELVATAADKTNFLSLTDYIDFTKRYLDFVADNLQAIIVSQNENHYQFYQYKEEGYFNITRPINARLMYTIADIPTLKERFPEILENIRYIDEQDIIQRQIIIQSIYTLQQCIGATLDASPPGQANRARKITGDLFERLIQLLIRQVGVRCETGTIQVPFEVDGERYHMSYQHDLLLYRAGELKAIGSVKTSSKDRLDKVFIDKFLYSKLTDTTLPHIAIFLNDVQRKHRRKENQYGINPTFLPGHFKGYTVKLNPLDGVYYCDIRPNMQTELILRDHIWTIDRFFCTDLWSLVS